MARRTERNSDSKTVISENTTVRIGLVIAFLSVFAASIWWASSVNSKLDSILNAQALTTSSVSDLQAKYVAAEKEISDIKLQNAIFEVSIKSLQDQTPNHK